MSDIKTFVEINAKLFSDVLKTDEKNLIIRPNYTLDYEESLLKKYVAIQNDPVKKKPERRSTQLFHKVDDEDFIGIVNSLSENKTEDIRTLRALCPGIKSDEEAKFYLEAASYRLEEAESLYHEQSIEIQECINVKMILPNNQIIQHKFAVTECLWDICPIIYNAIKSDKQYKVTNQATSTEITIEELTSMSFSNYGFGQECSLVIEYI